VMLGCAVIAVLVAWRLRATGLPGHALARLACAEDHAGRPRVRGLLAEEPASGCDEVPCLCWPP
jgi:hypothetical protein